VVEHFLDRGVESEVMVDRRDCPVPGIGNGPVDSIKARPHNLLTTQVAEAVVKQDVRVVVFACALVKPIRDPFPLTLSATDPVRDRDRSRANALILSGRQVFKDKRLVDVELISDEVDNCDGRVSESRDKSECIKSAPCNCALRAGAGLAELERPTNLDNRERESCRKVNRVDLDWPRSQPGAVRR